MGVDKVILRSVLSTLAAIVLLFAFMIVALVGFYPATVMELTYDLGMDSTSVRFAERAYKESDDIYYIAYATEVAIGDKNYGKINSCGEKFIADEAFERYCAEKNENIAEGVTGSYEQYVYGQVCMAKYARGEKSEAVDRAFELLGTGFPANNAVVAVLVKAMQNGDTETVGLIKGKMEERQDSVPSSDAEYFNAILALMQE